MPKMGSGLRIRVGLAHIKAAWASKALMPSSRSPINLLVGAQGSSPDPYHVGVGDGTTVAISPKQIHSAVAVCSTLLRVNVIAMLSVGVALAVG